MMLPAIVWIFVFNYVPLYGILIAFKKFNFKQGIWGSPWAGLDNFTFLFRYRGIEKIFLNTVFLNVLFLLFGTFTSVVLALMFVEITNKRLKKITQSLVILPHFVSWTVIALFTTAFIGGSTGVITKIVQHFTGENPNFYGTASYWPYILVILKVWQSAGFGTVVYIAAITGFDLEMYEAARVDGATRWQQITRITLPLLKTTIILLTIMAVGGIFRGDFGMIYALVGDNSMLFPTTDVIDTFSYRALRQLNNLGMSTATSFFQSVVGFLFVYISNMLVKKVEPDSAIF